MPDVYQNSAKIIFSTETPTTEQRQKVKRRLFPYLYNPGSDLEGIVQELKREVDLTGTLLVAGY